MNRNKKPLKRVVLLLCADVLLAALAYIGAYFVSSTADGIHNFPFAGMLVVIGIYCVIFSFAGIARIIWRYALAREYCYLVVVSCIAGLAASVIRSVCGMDELSLLKAMLCCACTVLAHLMLRLGYRYCREFRRNRNTDGCVRLLIIGAGEAGVRLVEEIEGNPDSTFLPVGFLDDNVQKVGRTLHKHKVLGTIDSVQTVCTKHRIGMIIVAIPSATGEQRARILDKCVNAGCPVKILPCFDGICESGDYIAKVRAITPEELLGREIIRVADDTILSFVTGKTIVITGGGGSIGSELCRQVAAHSPRRLVLIDVYENNVYAIQQELIAQYGASLDLVVYIATVCDAGQIRRLFMKERPDIVLHAAAHKHVPLMETVPDEAVKNNVFGTWNTVMAAREAEVARFVLISTDKAVNPTNIMGATKRLCEMIVQYADTVSPRTTFSAVRFGNVFASNGSAIVLFREQIEAKKDVTVTHPDMIRYFMTIPEASQLVLTAGAMANGGEIFVLDMGEPVRIDTLARKMIRLSGLVEDRDIRIRYVGLRPGEKLFEEVLMNEEGLRKTLNDKIFIGSPIQFESERFLGQLEALRVAADTGDAAVVEEKLMEMVPTFRRRAASEGESCHD